jgi:hypothetical protein
MIKPPKAGPAVKPKFTASQTKVSALVRLCLAWVANETNMVAGRNISATVIMTNIPIHNPKSSDGTKNNRIPLVEQTENQDSKNLFYQIIPT